MDHVLILLITFMAFFNQSMIGFGASVTLVSLGALFFPIETILPAFLPVNVLLSLTIVVPNREHVQWRLLLTRVLPIMLLGAPFGMWLFDIAPEKTLKAIFGGLVGILSVRELVSIYRARNVVPDKDEPGQQVSLLVQCITLFLGGVVHGAYSSGGPMIVYVTGRAIPEKTQFRATMCSIWVVMNIILTTRFILTGRYDLSHAMVSLEMLLALPLALWLGSIAHDKLPVHTFRILVFVALLVISGILLTTSLS